MPASERQRSSFDADANHPDARIRTLFRFAGAVHAALELSPTQRQGVSPGAKFVTTRAGPGCDRILKSIWGSRASPLFSRPHP